MLKFKETDPEMKFHKNCFRIFTKDRFQELLLYPMLVILALAMVFIVLTNTLMITGMIRINKKLSVSKKLFIILCLSDLFTGVTTVPIQTVLAVLNSEASCQLVALQAFFNMFTPGLSMFLLLKISLVRYSALKIKSKLKVRVCQQNVIMLILGIEVMVATVFGLWYSLHISQTVNRYAHGAFLIFISSICILIIGTTLIINVLLFTNLSEHNVTSTKSISKKKSDLYQNRVTKTILIISVSLVLCYFPVIISFSMTSYFVLAQDPRMKYYHYLISWSFVPLLLNSGFNSLIFILRNKKLKRCIRKMMTPCACKPVEISNAISNLSKPASDVTTKAIKATTATTTAVTKGTVTTTTEETPRNLLTTQAAIVSANFP